MRAMLVSTTILRDFKDCDPSTLPLIGDEVEIDDRRYTVANRVWEYPAASEPELAVILVER